MRRKSIMTIEEKLALSARIRAFDEKFDDPECPPLTAEQLKQLKPWPLRGKPVFIRPPKNSCISLWDTSNIAFLLQKDGTVVAIPRIPEEKESSKVVEEVMV
jgi:hypothetical protein